MPRIQALAPVLRSFPAPRALGCPQQCRFSTTPRISAPKPYNPSKEPSLPPNATSKAPSTPKEAQRAADLAAAEAVTESDSAQPPEPKPTLPSTLSSFSKESGHLFPPTPTGETKSKPRPSTPNHLTPLKPLPPPTYHVSRTKTGNLPVYHDTKRGGNYLLTTVAGSKTTGDLQALRDELLSFLNLPKEKVTLQPLTKHIVISGHRKAKVERFLEERGM